MSRERYVTEETAVYRTLQKNTFLENLLTLPELGHLKNIFPGITSGLITNCKYFEITFSRGL